MKMRHFILYFFVFFVCVSSSFAVTLDELMDAAENNRDLVKKYKGNLEKSRQDIVSARSGFLPSIDVGYTANNLDEPTVFEAEENSTVAAALTLNVFAGFKDRYALKSAGQMKEMDAFELAAIKQDIRLNAALGYITVKKSIENLQVAEEAFRLYREKYDDVRLKHSVGILTKSDMLKIKVEMDNAEQNVILATSDVARSFNNLNFETGLDISKGDLDFSVFDSLPEKKEVDYGRLLLERRSELNALRAYKNAAGFNEKAARASLYPQADILASWSRYEDDYIQGSGDYDDEETRVQMKISMNLFDGMDKYARMRKARIESGNADYEIKELENRLKTALDNILLEYDVAVASLKVAQGSVVEADENLRVTEYAFKKGVATSTDLRDAIYYRSRARYKIIEAYANVFESNFRLKRMIEDL